LFGLEKNAQQTSTKKVAQKEELFKFFLLFWRVRDAYGAQGDRRFALHHVTKCYNGQAKTHKVALTVFCASMKAMACYGFCFLYTPQLV
jgi:hypothetical protein